MATKVYQYGLHAPVQGAELVHRQMRLAHNYHNKLIEAERARRAAIRDELEGQVVFAQALAAARKAAQELGTAIDVLAVAKQQSSPRAELVPLQDAVATSRGHYHELLATMHVAEKVAWASRSSAISEVNDRAREYCKAARAHFVELGMYWGQYQIVDPAMDASRQKMPLYDGAAPNDPRFLRWDGEGAIGVQIQKSAPMTGAEVFAAAPGAAPGRVLRATYGDTRLRIERIDPLAWSSPMRSERRRLACTKLWMRVGSTDVGAPVWAAWPVVVHRQPPSEGQLKFAKVCLRRAGPHWQWTLHLSIEGVPVSRDVCADAAGAVALDLGWRKLSGSLRVARWLGEDGDGGEIVLDDEMLRRLEYPDGLRRARDDAFNAVRKELAAWVESNAVGVPAWLHNELLYMARWHRPAKLACAARAWETQRFPGDEQGLAIAQRWAYHDHHLWGAECGARQSVLAARKELFRVGAAKLSRRYTTLVLEDFNLCKPGFAEHDLPETAHVTAYAAVLDDGLIDVAARSEARQRKKARSNRQRVAVSELRGALVNAFIARARVVDYECAVNTTRRCNACGGVCCWDAMAELHHVCEHCGGDVVWDQDDNACENLLQAWRERLCDGKTPGAARRRGKPRKEKVNGESKWARVRREKCERETKTDAARASGEIPNANTVFEEPCSNGCSAPWKLRHDDR